MVDAAQDDLAPPPPHPSVIAPPDTRIVPVAPTPSVAALVKPGPKTSEIKFSAAAFAFFQVLAGAWLSLVATNSIVVPDWGKWIVPAITTLASAYLAGNYSNSRTAVKAAAASSVGGPRLY